MSQYWGATLGEMVEKSVRYERMAKAWYAKHGKPYPGDPGAPFLEIARRGAAGENIFIPLSEALRPMGVEMGPRPGSAK